jgi:hypothetical protein
VASTPRIAVRNVHEVHRVYEATNDRALQPMSLDAYRQLTPDATTTTGTPSHFVVAGVESVAEQPSAATSLYASSTSSGDTTQTVYVEGALTDNHPYSGSIALNGTTVVTVPGGALWTRVDRVYLSAAPAGAFYLSTSNGGSHVTDQLMSLIAGSTEARYLVVLLWPTPASAITYSLDVSRTVTDLAVGTDQPDLPEDWHDLVLLGALMDEYQHMSDERYGVAAQEYQQRLREFKYWLSQPATGLSVGEAPSRLGAWAPSGV